MVTISNKILSILKKKKVFNSKVARKHFKNKIDVLDSSVMRTARKLFGKKVLRRVSRGNYTLRKKSNKKLEV